MQAVREIMTSDPATMQQDAPVSEAAAVMRDRGIGDVLVMNDGELAGIVTDRDIVVRVLAEGRDATTTTVSEICTGDPVTVSPDDPVDRVVQIVRERDVRRVPVVDGGRPVGVVSIGDLAIDLDERSALADISSEPPNN